MSDDDAIKELTDARSTGDIAADLILSLKAKVRELETSLAQRREMIANVEAERDAAELALDEVDAILGVAPTCDHATTIEAVRKLATLVADGEGFKRQLAGLIHKWLGEQMQYPDTAVGNHAAAAVRLCAKELGDILNPPQPAPFGHLSRANPDEDHSEAADGGALREAVERFVFELDHGTYGGPNEEYVRGGGDQRRRLANKLRAALASAEPAAPVGAFVGSRRGPDGYYCNGCGGLAVRVATREREPLVLDDAEPPPESPEAAEQGAGSTGAGAPGELCRCGLPWLHESLCKR